MAINNFKAFGTDPLANVLDQASYEALAALALGYTAGIAASNQLNKTWRQSSVISSMIAQYIANQTGLDVLDDGNTATLLANFVSAITIGSGVKPARIVTINAVVFAPADYAVGLLRTAGIAAGTASLPAGAQIGQEFELADLNKSFAGNPITVTPPGGDNIAGDANFICNINKQVVRFKRYANPGAWSVKS